MGHTRADLTERPMRFWPVHSWLVVYKPESHPLLILRVISGWRDVWAELQRHRYPDSP